MLAVTRGLQALDCLRRQTRDLRRLDRAAFALWLEERQESWKRDPVFVQRLAIRDLRRARPELSSLERRLEAARAADAASPAYARLCELEELLLRADKAVAGLTRAGNGAPGGSRAEKLRDFRERQAAYRAELSERVASSPERQHLTRLQTEWQELREQTGLAALEERLGQLQRESGLRSTRSGQSFEARALEIAGGLLDEVGAAAVLSNVTLGAADTEFDQLWVDRDAVVRAAVEVKRNVNDLARGYLNRTSNLDWLSGASGELRPTSTFPTGRFDRPVRHEGWTLGPASFAGPVPLYLITRPGPVWGASQDVLGRLAHRLATDERPRDLDRLRDWLVSLPGSFETPELLELFADCPERLILLARQG